MAIALLSTTVPSFTMLHIERGLTSLVGKNGFGGFQHTLEVMTCASPCLSQSTVRSRTSG